jgi:hypothetical protein
LTNEVADMMSAQQISGLVILLIGIVALIVSVSVAWTLSRITRTRQVEGISFISIVAVLLFLVGMALSYFGVSALVEGGA